MKVSILLLACLLNPMGLEWDKGYKDFPTIDGYRYFYGDVPWGMVVYTGKEEILGLETEIQLFFSNNKLTKAILILGPTGFNKNNCIKKYKKITKLLSEKYGKNKIIHEIKDPMINDLVSFFPCTPIVAGLHEIKTNWNQNNYSIEAVLFGGEEEIYIEINYYNLFYKKQINKDNKKKILKKL